MTVAYYIYAPRYVPTSAGIRGLYALAQALRAAGQAAWIVTYAGHTQTELPDDHNDLLLDYPTALQHQADGRLPIVVYSETVEGNPLKARAIVRYVMNMPGLLGGPTAYGPEECVYAFSETLAQAIGRPGWSLFLPLVDENVFAASRNARPLTCVYASKYRRVHGEVPHGLPPNTVEISRDQSDSPDPAGLVTLLRKSRVLYLFENTALAIEAALCGCLVIFMPNAYLELSIGAQDHSDFGMAWGDAPEEVERARRTLPQFRQAWLDCKARFPARLALFIERTTLYRQGISGYGADWSALKPPTYVQRASAATGRYLRDRGVGFVLSKGLNVLVRHGPAIGWSIVRHYVVDRLGRRSSGTAGK